MKVATRLLLVLLGTVVVIIAGYMAVSHRQRVEELRGAMVRDTQTLARSLHAAIAHGFPDGRLEAIDRMLAVASADEAIFATMLLDPEGALLAGGPDDPSCLRAALPAMIRAGGASGWADCGERVFWIALALDEPDATLVVARRELLLDQAVAGALRRQMNLILVLFLAIALVLPLVLHGMLISPLAEILRGLRRLGEEGEMPRIQVRESAGELAILGAAINELAGQLEQKRNELIAETEEKVALEQRLRAAEKFAMIGRLSGGLGHELGSPLSVVAIRAQAILYDRQSSAAARMHAEVIEAQARRLTDFIQGLLHIARQQGIVFRKLDLREMLVELRQEMTPAAEAEDIEMSIEIPPEPLIIRGQKTLLRHALRNLVRNAIHALQEHPSERRIHVGVENQGTEIRLWVEDTGPGIRADQMAQVVEPFFTTKEVGRGMGLGLPITRGITEEHGGEMHLENVPGAGLRATLALPVHEPDAHLMEGHIQSPAEAPSPGPDRLAEEKATHAV